MEKRYIGIDLQRNQFTCRIRLENDRTYLTEWKLANLPRFVKKLRPSDEVVKLANCPYSLSFMRTSGNNPLLKYSASSCASFASVFFTDRLITPKLIGVDHHHAPHMRRYLRVN